MGVPRTLPADFTGFDAQGPPASLPADFAGFDQTPDISRFVEASKPWKSPLMRAVQASAAASVPRPTVPMEYGEGGFLPPPGQIRGTYENLTQDPLLAMTPVGALRIPRGVERIARATPGAPSPLPTEPTAPVTGFEEYRPAAITPEETVGAREIVSGAGALLGPLLVGGVATKPVQTVAILAAGQAVGKGAEEALTSAGVEPQAAGLASDVLSLAAMMGAAKVAGTARGSYVETPEATGVGGEILGGKAKVAGVRTPEGTQVGVKVGPLKAVFGGKKAAPVQPQLEPPTIEGQAPAEIPPRVPPETPQAVPPPSPEPAPVVPPAPLVAEPPAPITPEVQAPAPAPVILPPLLVAEPPKVETPEAPAPEPTPTQPTEKRIDYERMKQVYPKQKAALTRAQNLTDPAAKRDAVVKVATEAVAEWDQIGAWPDNWSRWQRAVDDAEFAARRAGLPPMENTRLEDLQTAPQGPAPAPTELKGGKPAGPTPEEIADLKARIAAAEAKLSGKGVPGILKGKKAEPTLADEEKAAGFPGPDFETPNFQVVRVGGGKYGIQRKGEKGYAGYGTVNTLGAAAEKMRAAQRVADNQKPAIAAKTPTPTPPATLPAEFTGFDQPEKPAPSLELTPPPEDIGVQQFIQTLPPDQRDYAHAAWNYLKEHGKEGLNDNVFPNEHGLSDEAGEQVDQQLVGILDREKPTPARVKLVITSQDRFTLGRLGYSPEQIDKLTPEDAGNIIDGQIAAPAKPSPVPAIEAAKPQKPINPIDVDKVLLPKLAESVYQKLSKGESLGNVTAFNQLAAQSLGPGWRTSTSFSPKDAFDAMEAGINKYLSVFGDTLMRQDAITGLGRLKELEGKLTSQGVRTEEQLTHQQFSTPPRESYVVSKIANIQPNDVVLEPSAGNGGLAIWAKAMGAKVYANEISVRRLAMLKYLGFDTTNENGEIINSKLPPNIKPTVVVMNPPFSAKAGAGPLAKNSAKYGFNHVDSALQRLQPGGRLVTILGGGRDGFPTEGATFANPAADQWFSRIAKNYNIRANVRVSGKEYQKYGTNYATRLIVIDKTGPTPIPKTGNWRDSVVQGSVDTLEQAYNLLRSVAEDRNVAALQTRPVSETGAREPQPGERLEPAGEAGIRGTGNRPEPVRAGGGEPSPVRPAGRPAGVARPGRPAGSVGINEPGEGRQPVPRPEPVLQPTESHAGPTPGSIPATAPDLNERPIPGDRTLTPTAPEKLDLTQEGEHADREQADTGAYVSYQPRIKGPVHPGDIVETKTMATVPSPPISYKPALPESIVNEGKLSAVQLEAVALAGQANSQTLPGGFRASMLIGDGTGVGKGREGAAILLDNWNQGRKRLVWVSKNWDLMQDAIRDLKGIGADELASKMVALQDIDYEKPIEHQGILFTTYSSLRAKDKQGHTRIAQIEKWVKGDDNAEGGYTLFDESHNLKNAVTAGVSKPSQVGQTAREFLLRVPNLRIVSLSATAASDVVNLGYLDRLGLWGPGTPFPNGFDQFMTEIGSGGISAMELVARELKAQGKYMARTLSMKGSTYEIVEVPLTDDQKDVYRTAGKAWQLVLGHANDTIRDILNGGASARGDFLSQFYSAQQRFFNLLLTTLKVPAAVDLANQALATGEKAVVITLVNTNEAAQNREKERVAASDLDEEEIPDYDFGPKSILTDMIRNNYPTQQWEDAVDDQGRPYKRPVNDENGNPVQNPEAVRRRDELIAQIDRDLHMPDNPLDILINSLGGPNKVAELTGRKERFDSSTGKFVPRGEKGVPRKKVNIEEAKAFQSGRKEIAVLSGAADTGISLHASRDAKNQKRRYHITLQTGWSADRAMQMLGRTLRTNQVSAPEYILLASDVAGEKRFLSSIARRLGSLGALSRGQKGASTGTDALDKFNFETNEGRAAARAFYDALERPGSTIPSESGKEISGDTVLRQMGVMKQIPNRGEGVPDKDKNNITKLLNRILILDPDTQNAVFDYYADIFQANVQRAIDEGTLDTGVRTLPGDEFNVKEERAISTDPATGAKTYYYPVEAKVKLKRASLDWAKARLASQQGRILVNEKGHVIGAYDATPIVHADGRKDEASRVFTPGNSIARKVANYEIHRYKDPKEIADEALEVAERKVADAKQSIELVKERGYGSTDRYQKELEEAQAELAKWEPAARDPKAWVEGLWKQQYESAPNHETVTHHLIGGTVLRWWNPIREASHQQLHVFTTLDSQTGKRVVGVEIPPDAIRKLVDRIAGSKTTVSGEQLGVDVLKSGLTYTLEGGIQVRRGTVARTPVVQLLPPNEGIAQNLKRLGVRYERGVQPIYYIPTRETFGMGRLVDEKVLAAVLKEYPIASSPEGEVSTLTPQERIARGIDLERAKAELKEQQVETLPEMLAKSETGTFEPGKLADAIKKLLPSTPPEEVVEKAVASAQQETKAQGLFAQKLARAKAAGQALVHWYMKGAVEYTNFDKALRAWDGAKQIAGREVKDLMHEAQKAVPDRLAREAIVNVMESGGDDPDVLTQRAAEVPKRFKAGYEKAKNLSDSELAVAKTFRKLMDDALDLAKKEGVLEHGVEDYIQHIWKSVPEEADKYLRKIYAELNLSSLQPNPSFTRQRVWETYFEGEKYGAIPQNKDAVFLVGYHLRSLYNAIADRAFIKGLFKQKAQDGRPFAIVGGGVRIPEGGEAVFIKPQTKTAETGDYQYIHHPALRRWKWSGEDPETGKTFFMQGDVYVHPEIAGKLRNIFGKSAIREFKLGPVHPGRMLLGFSSGFKNILLQGIPSFFHETTVRLHAAEHRVFPVGVKKYDLNDPETRDLIRTGLKVFDGRGFQEFSEGLAPGAALYRLPGIGKFYQWYASRLFEDVIPNLKVAMAKEALTRNLKRYPDLSRDQVLMRTADQSNAAFGELNYTAMARNKTVQDFLRTIFLAPDFFEARARFVGQAVRPYGREQLVALVLGAAVIYTLGRILNQLLDNDLHLDRPFSVVVKGHEYSLRTIQGDVLHAFKRPGQFVMVRLHPATTRGAIEGLTGRNEWGQRRSPSEQFWDFVHRVVPIPTQALVTQKGMTRQRQALKSFLQTFGINEMAYRTDAEYEAMYKREPKPSNAGQRPQADRMREYWHQIEERQLNRKRLEEDVRKGLITPADRAQLLRNEKRSRLGADLRDMRLDDAFDVWDKMTIEERKQNLPIMRQKAMAELNHYPPGAEKEQLRERIRVALMPKQPPPGYGPLFRRMLGR